MSTPENGIEERIKLREGMPPPAPNGSLETVPVKGTPTNGNIPNTPLASSLIAFCLGSAFTLGSLLLIFGGYPGSTWLTSQLGAFIASWALFHYLEFAVTAGWNREKCSVDSYLLDNGAQYHIANGIAVLEYIFVRLWMPSAKTWPYVTELGLAVVVAGQFLRSAAMIYASTNFSHAVASWKRREHQLVTDGIYAWFRHPSYAGFFYWALGTQLVLQNPISFVMYAIVLWRFFYYRTRGG
ncbi:hypothetical protein NMY22_g652 [Coprinellus aureogranulatus]|nr:hypothetical protein NMY22_g652 [Coprinellus aureogranulatus]